MPLSFFRKKDQIISQKSYLRKPQKLWILLRSNKNESLKKCIIIEKKIDKSMPKRINYGYISVLIGTG